MFNNILCACNGMKCEGICRDKYLKRLGKGITCPAAFTEDENGKGVQIKKEVFKEEKKRAKSTKDRSKRQVRKDKDSY